MRKLFLHEKQISVNLFKMILRNLRIHSFFLPQIFAEIFKNKFRRLFFHTFSTSFQLRKKVFAFCTNDWAL